MSRKYHQGEVNHCPGCWRAQWIIGRTLAECAFCGTAIPLAEQPSGPRPMLRIGKGGGVVRRMATAQ